MAEVCKTCNKRVMGHAFQVRCISCSSLYHLKCITLNTDDQMYICNQNTNWYCEPCNTVIFPFNQIDDDVCYINAIAGLSTTSGLVLSNLSDNIFRPFDLRNSRIYLLQMLILISISTMSSLYTVKIVIIIWKILLILK